MLGSQHPDKSAVGRKRTDSASASITEKSNLQLLNEVEAMLSVPAEEMDTDRIEEYLSLLQKKAPVTEHYDPEEKWAKLEESHPLILKKNRTPASLILRQKQGIDMGTELVDPFPAFSVRQLLPHRGILLYYNRQRYGIPTCSGCPAMGRRNHSDLYQSFRHHGIA